jgi:hypothetical protein
MTSYRAPICMECTRYVGSFRCEAYPTRIPDAILHSEVDHQQPYDGDGGLQFVAKDPERVGQLTQHPFLTSARNRRELEGYSTDAGRIDLFCVDRNGAPVVFELKAGAAGDDVVGQFAGYVRAATRMIPGLTIKTYELSFRLRDVES